MPIVYGSWRQLMIITSRFMGILLPEVYCSGFAKGQLTKNKRNAHMVEGRSEVFGLCILWKKLSLKCLILYWIIDVEVDLSMASGRGILSTSLSTRYRCDALRAHVLGWIARYLEASTVYRCNYWWRDYVVYTKREITACFPLQVRCLFLIYNHKASNRMSFFLLLPSWIGFFYHFYCTTLFKAWWTFKFTSRQIQQL